ncbi:MAG: Formiminotetrahydrofolate cyclodeaminase [Candidatus Fermentimicrarchaeum limneticum]|uniref:Formiminotetrahydrofolate cyclodeaminase n=1 Tax=Fermentimicrarchaeum limneticum TaxID=2795018 RepID=A0A7D6BHB2_FERL1|nr:MAG: Formiminotetrahydrofolate cyclodeaminase [Candidatus Fermentimicrarchaeum limneticum]
MKVHEFLDGLASPSPTPGGGGASALLCSMGAALVSMVCHLTIGKKGYEESEPELKKILEEAEILRKKAEELIDKDTNAFNEVMASYKTPKDKPQRADMIQAALKNATATPLEVAGLGVRVMELSKIIAFRGNINSVSDAGVAMLAADAGVRGALLNIRINLKSVEDEAFKGKMLTEIHELEEKSNGLREEVSGTVSFKLAN